MIISLRPGQHGRDEYVVCPRAPASVAQLRTRMLERAKVIEGTYAHRLIGDLHSAIFVQSLDLKADYEAYFTREYQSFDKYLRRRIRFSSDVVTKLVELAAVSSGLYHFRSAYEFLTDKYGIEFLTRLLEDSPAGVTT